MLEFIQKRIEHHANVIIANNHIILDLDSSSQACRQAQNSIFMANSAMAELSIIANELLTRNRAQK